MNRKQKDFVVKMLKFLPDKLYLKLRFRFEMKQKLDLKNPKTYNEKLQWLKINDRNPLYTTLVDKYAVKDYVANVIGKEHVIETYGVWDKFDDIDFNSLPNQFVLKATAGGGSNSVYICKDKNTFDFARAKKGLERANKQNMFYNGREWPYKNVPRKIIAEKFMTNGDKGLVDYKFFCFNGEMKFLYVSQGLDNHDTAEISFFDLDGNELYFSRSDYKRIKNLELPNNWEEVKKTAEKLCKHLSVPFVRIDVYSIENQVYFSEITFYPCSGFLPFEPKSADLELGNMIKFNK